MTAAVYEIKDENESYNTGVQAQCDLGWGARLPANTAVYAGVKVAFPWIKTSLLDLYVQGPSSKHATTSSREPHWETTIFGGPHHGMGQSDPSELSARVAHTMWRDVALGKNTPDHVKKVTQHSWQIFDDEDDCARVTDESPRRRNDRLH